MTTRIDLSRIRPTPRTRIDLAKLLEEQTPQTVNRDAKRDREDIVEAVPPLKGAAREAIGQALLLGYGDDVEGYVTGRHSDDIRRERMKFADDNPVLANASYVGGAAAGLGAPKIAKLLASYGKASTPEDMPTSPWLQNLLSKADDAFAGDEAAAAMRDRLEVLLNPRLPADASGLPPIGMFPMQEGETPSPATAAVSEEDPLAGMSPMDLLRLRQEMPSNPDEATAARNRQSAQDMALDVTPIIGNIRSGMDAYDSAGKAVDAFGGGDARGGLIQSALAALGAGGAVMGLPFGKIAREFTKGASSRTSIFVGPEARTADKEALKTAEEMRAAGANRDDIWRDTGWGWDQRDRPIFEVDDSAAKFGSAHGANTSGYGKNVFEHPELYATGHAPGKMTVREGERGGRYSAVDKSLHVQGSSSADRRSVALHELQHSVDDARGAGNGANWLFPHAEDLTDAKTAVANTYGAVRARIDAAAKRSDELWAAGDRAGANAAHAERMRGHEELDALRKSGAPSNPFEAAYFRNDGEVRARNVETRKDMSAAERRAKAPWHTQDVADEQQFTRSGNKQRAPSQILIPAGPGAAHQRALEMTEEGKPIDHIWRETQRGVSADGSVRREIRDAPMTFREGLQRGDNMALGEAVKHQDLFAVRPDLAERSLKITNHTDAMGNPVVRTNPQGGFEVNPDGGDMRGAMAKLLQYEVNKSSGLAAPLRHGTAATEKGIEDALYRADLLDPQDPGVRRAIDEYLDRLVEVRDQYDLIKELSGYSGVPGRGQPFSPAAAKLAGKNAGNVEGAIAQSRATLSPDELRAAPPFMSRQPQVGRKWFPSTSKQFVLPPEGLKGKDLREFILRWQKYGSGR